MNSLFRRLYREQEGQAIFLVTACLFVLIGAAALSIDIGFLLHAQRELQASTDAAATAAAVDLSNNTSAATAESDANLYSGMSGGKNYSADQPGVQAASGFPAVACLTVCSEGQTTGCVPGATLLPTCDNLAGGNAIAVQYTVQAPTFFGKIFGISTVKLTASAFALEKGSTPIPANIVLVVDTTNSMGQSDPLCTVSGISSPTREDCAKGGVRILLQELSPCGPTGCGSLSGSNVNNPYDVVSILIFPGLTGTSYYPDDYDCQTPTLSISNGISKYAPPGTQPPYASVVGFSSDYKTSDSATSLNGASSDLVKAVDWADGNSCTSSAYGLQNPGGAHTYYAGVLTEAQSDLTNIGTIGTSNRTNIENAIILLSDGAANATWCSPCSEGQQMDFTASTPSSYGQSDCQQAVTVGQNDAKAGTYVYAVAYGSSNQTSLCATDNSTPISPCTTMQDIASSPNSIPDPSLFYADAGSVANGCKSTANPNYTSLSQIFQAIGYTFLSTRLLPFSLYVPPS